MPRERIIFLPETFLPILPNYGPGIPKILFNQNGAYSFGLGHDNDGFPKDPQAILQLYNHPDLKHIACVSQHDLQLITGAFGFTKEKVTCIRNAIETELFKPSRKKKKIITYMPRKNRRDADIVKAFLSSKSWFKDWKLQAIDGIPQDKVIELLQISAGFLAFGHPEGFGLPLVEASACGCALIGYSGLGGREIFRIAKKYKVGWEIEYGDWQGFVVGAEQLIAELNYRPHELSINLQSLSKEVRKLYSKKKMLDSVKVGMKSWEYW